MAKKSKYLRPDIEHLKKDLNEFLTANPEVELQAEESKIAICKAWGDDTLRIDFTEKTEELVATLNDLILPQPFTAIYHRSKRSIEFIYSAFAKPEELQRVFSFTFDNKIYQCAFRASSASVLLLAEAFQPSGPASHTDYRNLITFKRFLRYKDDEKSPWANGTYIPASFWIDEIDYDESKLVKLSQHLNFYSYYFDRDAPRIIIHDTKQSVAVNRLTKAFGEFPATVQGPQLDDYLLGLWESAIQASDVFRRYLYFYQMLEYSAFYFIQAKVMCQLSRILIAPETSAFPQTAAQRVLDTMTTDRMTDEAKIEAIIAEAVDPEILWKEFEVNLLHFTADIVFEGGFTLKALFKADAKKSEFLSSWERSVPNALRKIRNALVHAREARMSDVISPSSGNFQKLAPWIGPLSRISMQVSMYVGSEKA